MLTFRFLYVFRFFRFLRKFDFWSLLRNVIFTGSCTAIWGAVGGGDFDLILKMSQTVVSFWIPMSFKTLLNVVQSCFGDSLSDSGSRFFTMTDFVEFVIWQFKSSRLRVMISVFCSSNCFLVDFESWQFRSSSASSSLRASVSYLHLKKPKETKELDTDGKLNYKVYEIQSNVRSSEKISFFFNSFRCSIEFVLPVSPQPVIIIESPSFRFLPGSF